MWGKQTSQAFVKQLAERGTKPFLWMFKDWLSTGTISYYMHHDEGWCTRTYLHNYYALLAQEPFPAEWETRFYARDGRLVHRGTGSFNGPETVVIDSANLKNLDTYGVIYTHVRVKSSKYFFPEQYNSIFFNEYYVPGTERSIFAHNLGGSLKATHYSYHRLGTSAVTPPGFRPYLFLANACAFHPWGHPDCGRATVTVINHAEIKKTIVVPSLPRLSCHKLDLFALCPELPEHMNNQSYILEVEGKNILAKPFLFQTNGKQCLAEHL